MRHFRLKNLLAFLLLTIVWAACSDDDDPEFPFSAQLSYSLVKRQAAFAALVNGSNSYSWDFGDGETSTERNPVHVYKDAGFYTVVLKVQGPSSTITDDVFLAVDITPHVLLTGGAKSENGKKWRIDASHPKDKFAFANEEFEEYEAVTAGVLGSLGLGEVYEDEFTFFFDGSYKHDVKADKASFAGLLNQYAQNGGANVVSIGNGADEYGLCTAGYTPESDATFELHEDKDYDVPSLHEEDGIVTYKDVTTVTFSGTEFIGFLDYNREAIIQDISNTSMRVVIFVAASQDDYPLASHALVLTFKAVE